MKLSKSRESTLAAIGRGAIITDAVGQKAAKWLVANGLAYSYPNWCCFRLTCDGKDIFDKMQNAEVKNQMGVV